MTPSTPPLLISRRQAILMSLAAASLTAACGGGPSGGSGSGGSSPGRGGTLSVGIPLAPTSLDPGKSGGAFVWNVSLAYDPLIYLSADGGLEPRLAESWRYADDTNTLFELTLRDGVTFSDGSPLTADVVKANVEYFQSAGGESAPALATVTSVEVVDELTVRMTLAQPNPMMPEQFTQWQLSGNVISGKALETPDVLATETFGTGPYVLDSATTVPSDHYTYVANPGYWNAEDVRYEKVVVKILPNPNTALSATQTGQVDGVSGDLTSIVDAAESAGLNVASARQPFWGLAFADRSGDLLPPLGDVRVRQAMNYAVNREEITSGLFGDWGLPTEQIVLPGGDGYDEEQVYSYDPDRARQLLAEAGYADGFELPVLSIETFSLMTQAIADDLGRVGITVAITNRGDATSYVTDLQSGTFPAYAIGYGTMPVHLMAPRLFLREAGLFNPRQNTDEEIERLYVEAAATPDEAARAELDRQIIRRLTDQAWFLPVSFVSLFTITRSTVAGVEMTDARAFSLPVEWHPAA